MKSSRRYHPRAHISPQKTKIACIVHVVRDRIIAAELIADVLCHDSGLDPELQQTTHDLRFQNLSQIHLRDPDMTVVVALHLLEATQILRRNVENDPLGDDGARRRGGRSSGA